MTNIMHCFYAEIIHMTVHVIPGQGAGISNCNDVPEPKQIPAGPFHNKQG